MRVQLGVDVQVYERCEADGVSLQVDSDHNIRGPGLGMVEDAWTLITLSGCRLEMGM